MFVDGSLISDLPINVLFCINQMQWCAYFGRDFWDGYRSIIPEDDGFEDRAVLYDAYHQLNHFNLFGGSYLTTATSDLNSLKDALDNIEQG